MQGLSDKILPELVRVEIFPDNRKRLDLAAAYCPEITSNENDILMLVLKAAWKRRHTHGEVKRKRERMVWRNAP